MRRVGNSGRNVLIGPGINNFDLQVFKDFRFTEFTQPAISAESPRTFGNITGARDPRIMQFVLKYKF